MGKRIKLKEITNFRDLGGYNTANSETQYGKIFRSSVFFGPNDEDLKVFKVLGLKTIIDLRKPEEVEKQPNQYQNLIDNYININLVGDTSKEYYQPYIKAKENDEEYPTPYLYFGYSKNKVAVKEIFDTILKNQDYAIAYHCSAGKDRTGFISYLILSLAGVEFEEIVNDYEVSFSLIKNEPRIMDPSITELNVHKSHPENIEIFHELFLKEYGSIEAYFKELDYDERQINALKNLLS